MISESTNNLICDFLLNLARSEKKLEVNRQILAKEEQFEPYSAFKRIDRNSRQSISAIDLMSFLNDNGLYYTEEVIEKSFISQYDIDQDKKLVFSEFLRAILPFDNPNLRSAVTQRPTYDVQKYQYLTEDIEKILSRLIENEVKSFIELDAQKQDIKNQQDFQISALFSAIDSTNEGYLDFNSILNYLTTNNYYPYEEEIITILRRFDKDDDGRLNFEDFAEGILPKYFPKHIIEKAIQAPQENKIVTNSQKFNSPIKNSAQKDPSQSQYNLQSSISPNKYPYKPIRRDQTNVSPLKQTSNLSPQKMTQTVIENISASKQEMNNIEYLKLQSQARLQNLNKSLKKDYVASPTQKQTYSPVKKIVDNNKPPISPTRKTPYRSPLNKQY